MRVAAWQRCPATASRGSSAMKCHTAVACILVVAWPIAVGAQRRPVKSDQDTLVELERNWNAAFYRKDLTFIANVLADEFTATYDDGSLGDKDKELSLVSGFNQQVDSAVPDDFVVTVYG